MFYILTVLIPLSIIVIGYRVMKGKRKKITFTRLMVRTLPFIYAYTILLYGLTIQNPEILGWEFYTILFFLIPVTVVVIILKSISFLRHTNKNER
jgi:hypothetical protein